MRSPLRPLASALVALVTGGTAHAEDPFVDITASTRLLGDPNEQFGAAGAVVGDMDGDGYADLVVGAPGAHAIDVFKGSATGIQQEPWLRVVGPEDGFGVRVEPAGDIDGDGLADVLVGFAPDGAGHATAFAVVRGASGDTTPTAEVIAEGVTGVARGTLDADPYSDVVLLRGSTLEVRRGGPAGVGDTIDRTVDLSAFAPPGVWEIATLGRFDADLSADVLATTWNHVVVLSPYAAVPLRAEYHGSGSGDYSTALLDAGPAGDLDSDGHVDVWIYERYDRGPNIDGFLHRIHLRSATESLARLPSWWTMSNELSFEARALGDVDGDGHGDLFEIGLASRPDAIVSGSTPGSEIPVDLPATPFTGTGESLDGDCTAEVVVSAEAGTVDVYTGLRRGHPDLDGDGFGDPSRRPACGEPAVADGTDCDDGDDAVLGSYTYFTDADGDGHGDEAAPYASCEPDAPPGYAQSHDDCDDTRADTYPGAPEICDNGRNEDCDFMSDEWCDDEPVDTAPLDTDDTPPPDTPDDDACAGCSGTGMPGHAVAAAVALGLARRTRRRGTRSPPPGARG